MSSPALETLNKTARWHEKRAERALTFEARLMHQRFALSIRDALEELSPSPAPVDEKQLGLSL